ncbi:MAG: hypothetical protein KAT49_01740 [Methanomicrobia archaeon]|nr:hypothetical protein [Methanomicrobia archaeon]
MEFSKDIKKERQLEQQNREMSEEIDRLLAKERTPTQFKKPKGLPIERIIRTGFKIVIILVGLLIICIMIALKALM